MFGLPTPIRTPERPIDPPELPGFNGEVCFAAFLEDETVEVFADIEEDEIVREQTEVRYHGVDIAPLLCESQWQSLQAQFGNEYDDICRFDRMDD
jgi:hypothetical protein